MSRFSELVFTVTGEYPAAELPLLNHGAIKMDSREALKLALDCGDMVGLAYLDDMTDEELMKRPCEGCNHIKWQLGHLIASEHQMVSGVAPDAMPALPDGFADKYSKETATSDDPSAFDSKEALLGLFKQQRAASVEVMNGMSDEDLSKPTPEGMQSYAPTAGAAFNLLGGHWLMHAGQWAVVRRQLGRPPLF